MRNPAPDGGARCALESFSPPLGKNAWERARVSGGLDQHSGAAGMVEGDTSQV